MSKSAMTAEQLRIITTTAIEFGFKQCEAGHNLEMAISNYFSVAAGLVPVQAAHTRQMNYEREKALKTSLKCPTGCGCVLRPDLAQNSSSRFANTYVCSTCGTREALEGFFWKHAAVESGVEILRQGK